MSVSSPPVLQALNLLEQLADAADPARDGIGRDIAREELPKRANPARIRKVKSDG